MLNFYKCFNSTFNRNFDINRLLPIVIFVIYLFTSHLKADPILLDSIHEEIPLTSNTIYLIDEGNSLTIDNLLTDTELNWNLNTGKVLNFGPKGHTVWTKIQIRFPENINPPYFIKFDFPTIDDIEFYEINDSNQVTKQISTGDSQPFYSRPIPSHVFLFPFTPSANETKTFLVRARTTASLSIPLSLMDYKTLYENDTIIYLMFGLYFGLILAMLVYNFVFYLYTKDISNALYIFYAFSYFVVVFAGFGFGFRFIYPESVLIEERIFISAVAINSAMAIVFSIQFLKLKRSYPRLTKFLYSFAVISISWAVLFNILNSQKFYSFTIYITGIPIFFIFTLAILECRRSIFALYFVLAWGIFLLFYAASIFRLIGILPTNFLTYYGIQIGSVIQMLLLSLSIGHKTYEIRKQSNEIFKENILLKDKANKELKQQVLEQTLELNEQIKSIESDVEMARQIQLNTLPKSAQWKEEKVDIATIYLPKDRVSGDIYDYFKIDEDRYRFFIADATGHGIQAGFLTMNIQTEYQRIKSQYTDPAQILRMLNNSVFNTFGNETVLYSCCLIDIDISQRYLVYSSAGHPSQYLLQEGEFIDLKSLSTLVGFRNDIVMKSKSLPLKDQFKLFLYSDGLTEASRGDHEEFGEKRYKQVILDNQNLSAVDLNVEIFKSVNTFIQDHYYEDDYTSIVVDFKK
ncbi:MAG: SpoIIE family protein phosphatase [Leptospira sp.]|nr:SpoIIE family protein phosphatase [Leptospira sp.]NCS92671.1 SpoIIE family protein phosphatase [Leptospira sp.]